MINVDMCYSLQSCNKEELGKVFANRDAVYVLCYAILMLNTDQYSTQVKKRMSLEVIMCLNLCSDNSSPNSSPMWGLCVYNDTFHIPRVCSGLQVAHCAYHNIVCGFCIPVHQEFIHNQRKINNGEDFPRQFLTDIFNRIRLANCPLSIL